MIDVTFQAKDSSLKNQSYLVDTNNYGEARQAALQALLAGGHDKRVYGTVIMRDRAVLDACSKEGGLQC